MDDSHIITEKLSKARWVKYFGFIHDLCLIYCSLTLLFACYTNVWHSVELDQRKCLCVVVTPLIYIINVVMLESW